ncbi:MAG: putative Pre-mRNA-processing factor 6 [Streblomastix strix]|uniref:Putative Pre-mRNA-processing factor 6 n=1 Tax=Streblomastix strix TaxID=222440 RepID=A0A5J4V8U8_9EUKA|nr:MAG: putative Pre-mRNA-processing factor 6 [Streblomastix strix]
MQYEFAPDFNSGAPMRTSYVAGLGRGAKGFTTSADPYPGSLKKPDPTFGAAPPGYVPGVGRGAKAIESGVKHLSTGPSKRQDQTYGKDEEDDKDELNDANYDNEYGYNKSLFGKDTPYDDEDQEADNIYDRIADRMSERRKRQRDNQEKEMAEKRMKTTAVSHLFKTESNNLKMVSELDWAVIPESRKLTKRKQTSNRDESKVPVPDSIIANAFNANALETSFDPSSGITTSLSGAATSTGAVDLVKMTGARKNVLQMQLDKILDNSATLSKGKETSVKPDGYITSLEKHNKSKSNIEFGDVEKKRSVLMSACSTNPTNARTWIAASLFEEEMHDLQTARKLITKATEHCPYSEEAWLESIRLHAMGSLEPVISNQQFMNQQNGLISGIQTGIVTGVGTRTASGTATALGIVSGQKTGITMQSQSGMKTGLNTQQQGLQSQFGVQQPISIQQPKTQHQAERLSKAQAEAMGIAKEATDKLPQSVHLWIRRLDLHLRAAHIDIELLNNQSKQLFSRQRKNENKQGSDGLQILSREFINEKGRQDCISILMEALTHVSNSLLLWQRLIILAGNSQSDREKLLRAAIEVLPHNRELYQQLSDLVSFNEAMKVLNQMRVNNPWELGVYVDGAILLELRGTDWVAQQLQQRKIKEKDQQDDGIDNEKQMDKDIIKDENEINNEQQSQEGIQLKKEEEDKIEIDAISDRPLKKKKDEDRSVIAELQRMIDQMLKRCVIQFVNEDKSLPTLQQWLDEARRAEREEAPLTAKQLVTAAFNLQSMPQPTKGLSSKSNIPIITPITITVTDIKEEAARFTHEGYIECARQAFECAIEKTRLGQEARSFHNQQISLLHSGMSRKEIGTFSNSDNPIFHDYQALQDTTDIWRQYLFFEKTKGDRQHLLNAYDRALQMYPKDSPSTADLSLFAARCEMDSKNKEEARSILEKARRLNKTSETLWMAAVKLECEDGNIDGARKLLDEAVIACEGSTKIILRRALIYRQLGRSDECIKILRKARKYKDPSIFRALALMCEFAPITTSEGDSKNISVEQSQKVEEKTLTPLEVYKDAQLGVSTSTASICISYALYLERRGNIDQARTQLDHATKQFCGFNIANTTGKKSLIQINQGNDEWDLETKERVWLHRIWFEKRQMLQQGIKLVQRRGKGQSQNNQSGQVDQCIANARKAMNDIRTTMLSVLGGSNSDQGGNISINTSASIGGIGLVSNSLGVNVGIQGSLGAGGEHAGLLTALLLRDKDSGLVNAEFVPMSCHHHAVDLDERRLKLEDQIKKT